MANTNYGLNLEITKAKVGSNGDIKELYINDKKVEVGGGSGGSTTLYAWKYSNSSYLYTKTPDVEEGTVPIIIGNPLQNSMGNAGRDTEYWGFKHQKIITMMGDMWWNETYSSLPDWAVSIDDAIVIPGGETPTSGTPCSLYKKVSGDWYKVSALSSTGVTLSDTAISTAALIEQLEAATPGTLYYVAGLMSISYSGDSFYRDSTKDFTIE